MATRGASRSRLERTRTWDHGLLGIGDRPEDRWQTRARCFLSDGRDWGADALLWALGLGGRSNGAWGVS